MRDTTFRLSVFNHAGQRQDHHLPAVEALCPMCEDNGSRCPECDGDGRVMIADTGAMTDAQRELWQRVSTERVVVIQGLAPFEGRA